MNTYITLACLLAVLGVSHCNPAPYGYGGGILTAPIIAPAAISSANLYKAAPISVIRTAAISPIIAPAVRTVPVLQTVGVGGYGYGAGVGLGYGGLGYGGLGYGGLGYGGLGYGGLGYGGLGYGGWGYGLGGKGLGLGGLGYGYGGKIIG